MEEHLVKVYVYDVTGGLARNMSQVLLGKQIDGIWHTSIVAFGQEYFFGGGGIDACAPNGTVLGKPGLVIDLGKSQIPFDVFMSYLEELSMSSFRPECYNLFEHNCNNFTAEVAQFLTGQSIPSYITDLPKDILDSPLGAMIKPFMEAMTVTPEGGQHLFPAGQGIPSSASSSSVPTPLVDSSIPLEKDSTSDKKPDKALPHIEAIQFLDELVLSDTKLSQSDIANTLSSQEVALLEEIYEYLQTKDCSWSLGRNHFKLLVRLLHSRDCSSCVLNCVSLLRLALSHSDVHFLLHTDTDHHILSFVNQFDSLETKAQQEVLRLCCNCCSLPPGGEWAVSTTDWTLESHSTNNFRVIARVCSSALLNEDSNIRTDAIALANNFTALKLSEEVAVEVGVALVQCVSEGINTGSVLYALISLLRCMKATKEVVELANVMGLTFDKYESSSVADETKAIIGTLRKIMRD